MIRRAGPFDVDDRDAPQKALADGSMHLSGAERRDEALALQFLLVGLHGPRHIDRQHEREIDLGLSLRTGTPDQQQEGQRE